MWGLMIRPNTIYRFCRFYRGLRPVSRLLPSQTIAALTNRPFPNPLSLTTSLPRRPNSGERGHENTTGRCTRPDGTFVAGFFPPATNSAWKSPCGKAVQEADSSSALVLSQGVRQGGGQVDAEIIGKQNHDEQHITELISERTCGILLRARFVAEAKIQLTAELANFLGQSSVLRQR